MEDKQEKKRKLKAEISGMLFGAAGLFLLIALISFNADDLSFNTFSLGGTTKNWGGSFGAQISDIFLQLLGLAAYLIPLFLLYLAYRSLRFKEFQWKVYKVIAFIGLLITVSALCAFSVERITFLGQQISTGGAVGITTSRFLKHYLGATGALLLLLPMLAACIMIISRFSFVLYADWWINAIADRFKRSKEKKAVARSLEKDEKKDKKSDGIVIKPLSVTVPASPGIQLKSKKKESAKSQTAQETFDFIESDEEYHIPPLSLLEDPPSTSLKVDKEALSMNAKLLEKKLKDFGIVGEVVEIAPGPVVTMYEFAPGPGIKVSRIAGLADDLSMALQALAIRIVAPIPGKGVVGIELPNRERETVYLKEILASEIFNKGKMRLPLALGKDIAGIPLVTDLAKMPHLLVAGATGAGKSVSINTMILSLLYTATPRDVRFIMVDPKMLELSIYEGIPHLLLPVVTNPKKAALALKWAVEEMGRRYRLMAAKGVRNIDSYNRELAKEEREVAELKAASAVKVEEIEEVIENEDGEDISQFLGGDEALEHSHLPYVVVIVDELADLMMVAGREIEESIARLAQMARAAGIHLILATQRPSVDVITGLIKANFPARLSFQVSSRVDSRTILDTMGAESLLGKGDMLFLPPGTAKLQRAHGALVEDAEVQRVVDFLKKQGKPVYDKSILEMKDSDAKNSDTDYDDDPQYDAAVAIVAEAKQASISMIQRKLRIGYNRAARIIERMEKEGIVGPSDGTSRPREVYINKI
ncbi:MAG: DNA translocase FtsK 4TM domain-containing protein [Desulfuromonadales bacterium]|nr:DNA translocase FtsK 4TM domain-containing protein [Desulfuromonadales bacterium]